MTSYTAFAEAFHEHFSSDANVRVELGIDRDLAELPDPSLAAGAADVASARALLEQLDAIQTDDFDEQLDLDLARLALERQILLETLTFNGRTTRQQMPDAGDGVGGGIFLLFTNDPRPAAARLDDITARLEQVPAYLEAMLNRLDTPVERWVSIDVQKVQGMGSLFDSIASWAQDESYEQLERLRAARLQAGEALTGYTRRLQDLPTTTHLHIGAEFAQRIVDVKAVGKTLDELHTMARDYLAEVRADIEELRIKLCARYELDPATSAADLQQFLAQRYQVKLPHGSLSDVLARYTQERARILAFIREQDLFPVFDEQDMLILRTPSFMEPSIPAGAMMSPPPFREGVRRSLVYLTLSEELLAEHTEITIPGMMIHEGIPGHHLQLATASRHPSLIRRHFDAMEHAEGWTTMLEDYMLDLDYMGELTDEARFSGKRDISRIGARVAIDLFFMTGERRYLDVGVDCDTSSDDPFEAAGALLQEVTGFVPGRVQAELNWYSQERGYPLSYLTGNRLVWGIKRDLAAHTGHGLEGLDLDRAFHRAYLESGNMPVTYLRRVLQHEGLLP